VRAGTRGFTLIELLVSIAIIGTLMALLFPVIRAVQVSAMEIQCQTNIGQLAKCVAAYCEQNQGVFPASITTTSPRASAGDWLFVGARVDATSLKNGVLAKSKIIATDAVTGISKICLCPLDEDSGLVRLASAIQIDRKGVTSYVTNASITYGDQVQGSGTGAKVRVRLYREFDPDDFLFIEQSSGVTPDPPSTFDRAYMMPPRGRYSLTSRHRGGGHVACMDGRVEWMRSDPVTGEGPFLTEMDKTATGGQWWQSRNNRWNPG